MNFSGGLFAGNEKQNRNIRPKNSGPEFGRPKFVSQNSALNSGSGGAKSPVLQFIPDTIAKDHARTSKMRFLLVTPF